MLVDRGVNWKEDTGKFRNVLNRVQRSKGIDAGRLWVDSRGQIFMPRYAISDISSALPVAGVSPIGRLRLFENVIPLSLWPIHSLTTPLYMNIDGLSKVVSQPADYRNW